MVFDNLSIQYTDAHDYFFKKVAILRQQWLVNTVNTTVYLSHEPVGQAWDSSPGIFAKVFTRKSLAETTNLSVPP